MITLKIDNKEVKVQQGATLLDAANQLGISIPTMCHLKGYSNHPSCMVCMVKDKKSGQLYPSCAYPAKEGMEISTNDEEVFEARRDALELLLSDHVGDCEAPCRIACPAFMDIPGMNRLIAQGKPIEALKLVKEEIALPMVLGYVCSAPCENACRRKSIDGAVSICQLKKYVALSDANSEQVYMPAKAPATSKHVAIIGAGIAGLACAFTLTKLGHQCTVFEKNDKAGGSLLNNNQGKELPLKILNQEIEILQQFGIGLELNKGIDNEAFNLLRKQFDALVIASGETNSSKFGLSLNAASNGFDVTDGLFSSSEKGVFVCGSAIKLQKMAVRALANGKAAAQSVHQYLSNQSISEERRLFNSKFGRLKEDEFSVYLEESIPDKRLEPLDTLAGFDNDAAILEAKRCMHCDCRKPKTCKLRNYADAYGAEQKHYSFGERNLIKKQFTHELIVYEPEKCIRCGLCVDITQKEKELVGLTYVGRGFDVRIGIPFNESLKNSLKNTALKCAEYCPTGAISLK